MAVTEEVSIETPREAIDAAMGFFSDFFRDRTVSNVLLEGLEFNPRTEQWEVSIGFDVGREKTTQPTGLFAAISATTEPIREVRKFVLDASSGKFIRMS